MMQLNLINRASAAEAFRLLFHCCGASRWARRMADVRPFATREAIATEAERSFDELTPADWLEAFTHHPQIGDVESLRKKFKDTAHLAGAEQAGAKSASDAVLKALTAGNQRYLEKFGFIFIVCATGKSAAEMLTLLEARLDNTRDQELAIAAGEQRKITMIRLSKIGGL